MAVSLFETAFLLPANKMYKFLQKTYILALKITC